MKDSIDLDLAYNNVINAIEHFYDSVNQYDDALHRHIEELAAKKKRNEIWLILSRADRVEKFKTQVLELKNLWQEVISNKIEPAGDGNRREDRKRGITTRTTCEINKGAVRIETERNESGTPYSNIVPLDLFKEISLTAIKLIQQNGFVKTSNVVDLLANEIVERSDYKKSPRVPVYLTFKILLKNNILQLDENNSHKYLLGSKPNPIRWIENLGRNYQNRRQEPNSNHR